MSYETPDQLIITLKRELIPLIVCGESKKILANPDSSFVDKDDISQTLVEILDFYLGNEGDPSLDAIERMDKLVQELLSCTYLRRSTVEGMSPRDAAFALFQVYRCH
jgi:hypothetical protein